MTSTPPTRLQRAARLFSTALLVVGLNGCSALSVPNISLPKVSLPKVSLPKVSLPKLPSLRHSEDTPQDLSATPRDLLGAKLINPRPDPNVPNLTVGKLMEFADRYLACDCANMRFGQSWKKVDDGYILLTNSEVVRPLHFVCKDGGDGRECFLAEIDRGPQTDALAQRFVPGGEFIKFLYENGVKCERATPCQ